MLKRLLTEWEKLSDERNILIYQMGKVGSTSLEQAIPGSIHCHTFYNHKLSHVFAAQKRNTLFRKIAGSLHDLYRRTAVLSRKEVKIITLVRDPYSRNVSAFFQDFAYWMYYYSCQATDEQRAHSDSAFVGTVFNKVYDHQYPLIWFDREIKRLTGVDIYKYNFDKERGWEKIKQKKYVIFMVKLEKLKDAWSEIEDFVGFKMEQRSVNSATLKWYHQPYHTFMKEYVPGPGYLDMLYSAKMTRHFYTDTEIHEFRQRALKNSTK